MKAWFKNWLNWLINPQNWQQLQTDGHRKTKLWQQKVKKKSFEFTRKYRKRASKKIKNPKNHRYELESLIEYPFSLIDTTYFTDYWYYFGE